VGKEEISAFEGMIVNLIHKKSDPIAEVA